MFEFDEHYIELEATQASRETRGLQENTSRRDWQYVGHDVWKLDKESDILLNQTDWAIETADVA